jgi:hypothetical protein
VGSLHRPKLKDWRTRPASDQRSAVWWCKYYVNGRPVRESTGTGDKEEAKRTHRYHIVSPADLQAASRRLAEADGHVSGHVRAKALDGAARNSAE